MVTKENKMNASEKLKVDFFQKTKSENVRPLTNRNRSNIITKLRHMIQMQWYWLEKWLYFKSPWSWTNSWWTKRYLKNESIPHKKEICKASHGTRRATSGKMKVVAKKVDTTAGNISCLNFNGTLLSHSSNYDKFILSPSYGTRGATPEEVKVSITVINTPISSSS